MAREKQDALLYLERTIYTANLPLMLLILKILLGLIGAVLLFLSFNWMIIPDKIMKAHDIESHSPTGYNFIRGDIGGILLAGAIMIGLFLWQGPARWFFPGVILIGSVILGRVIGLVVNGKSKKGIEAIVVEVLIISLMIGIAYLD